MAVAVAGSATVVVVAWALEGLATGAERGGECAQQQLILRTRTPESSRVPPNAESWLEERTF